MRYHSQDTFQGTDFTNKAVVFGNAKFQQIIIETVLTWRSDFRRGEKERVCDGTAPWLQHSDNIISTIIY